MAVGQRATTRRTVDRELGGCHPTFISPLNGHCRAAADKTDFTFIALVRGFAACWQFYSIEKHIGVTSLRVTEIWDIS